MCRPLQQPQLCCSRLLYDQEHRKTGISFCQDGAAFPEERLGVDVFLNSKDLPLFEELEFKLLLLFCLDYKKPLPLSEDDLLLLFFSDLLPEELAAGVSCAISTLHSQ